jgi:hypothetical protein
MLSTSLALAAILCTPVFASTDGAAEPVDRVNHIGANLGLFSSVGAFGLTYDRDLSRFWQIQAGAGLGSTGLEVSLMPRFMLRTSVRHALFLGMGASVGLPPDLVLDRPIAVWANGEAGYQYERSRFYFQFGLDYALLLRGTAAPPCLLCDRDRLRPGTSLPGFRFTAGVRF